MISRYREERNRGRDKLDAIDVTGRTASRAVAFSGMTVVLALLGMLIVPMTLFRSFAAGAIFVALASILASLTLLPALLAILGDRVNALRVLRHKGTAAGFWDRITHAVMRRPVTSVLLSGGVLALAAVPYVGINLGFPGVSTLPEDTNARRALAIMAEDFSGGLDSPVEIAIDADVTSPEVQAGSTSCEPRSPTTPPSGHRRSRPTPLATSPSSRPRPRVIPRATPPSTPSSGCAAATSPRRSPAPMPWCSSEATPPATRTASTSSTATCRSFSSSCSACRSCC